MEKNKHWFDEGGYFVVEILFIISLLALIAISGFNHWLRWLEYQQLQATGQSLAGYLQQGRSQAQRFNHELILVKGDKQQGCWLFFSSNSAAGLVTAQGKQCWQPNEPLRTQLIMLGNPGFYGLNTTAKAGSLELIMGRNRIRIIISTRGRIRISTCK